MDVFVLVVLVVLVMSLPALSWWGIMSQRKRQIDEAADRRMVDFVTHNAGTARGHARPRNPHARAAALAEQHFEAMARNSPSVVLHT